LKYVLFEVLGAPDLFFLKLWLAKEGLVGHWTERYLYKNISVFTH